MTMTIELHTLDLADYFEVVAGDAIRIKGHRIGIEHIIERYHEGFSPEAIALEFPGLSLEKIYAVITYYLHHKAELDRYLDDLRAWSEQSYQDAQTQDPPPVVRRLREIKAERLGQAPDEVH